MSYVVTQDTPVAFPRQSQLLPFQVQVPAHLSPQVIVPLPFFFPGFVEPPQRSSTVEFT